MARRLLAVLSALTSQLLVIPHPVVVVAETVVAVVAASVVAVVVVDSVVVVVVVTVVAAVASVVVAAVEIAVVAVETVAAVVGLQGTEVALAISRGRRRGSIKDEMIPREIVVMGGRMNRATWAEPLDEQMGDAAT